MSDEISMEVRDGILCVTVVGSYQMRRAQDWIGRTAESLTEHRCDRLLMDLRKVEGVVSVIDRFRLGEHAAAAFAGKVFLALWVSPEELDLDRFMETVASTRGLSAKVFMDGDAARSWLQSHSRKGES